MSEKTSLWDRLGKTDPNHTKGFKRAGGFSGTAIRPMWAIRRMTEEFGACGEGWGVNEPVFQVVPAGDEVLVFCTVGMWHGKRDAVVYGVGGDKCLTARKSGGAFADDEAFKKAYTDALTNAMKLIGVGADVHMGLFDDSKYVAQMRQEFAEPAPTLPDDLALAIREAGSVDELTKVYKGLSKESQAKYKAAFSERRKQLEAV